jgi:aspartate racemase
MKTLGIIGGIGPESTIHYYRAIIAAYRERRDGNYPSIVINSISVKKLLDLVGANELDKVTEFLAIEVERLARAGADFALLASNTPHIVFDQLQRCSSIPLVSIVQATAEAAKAQGLKKVGLFGTRFTMQARFYPEVFTREEIAVVLPHAHEQDFIHEKYIGELLNNIIRPDTRDRLLAIVKRMKEQDGIQGLILGGTELPLILTDAGDTGVVFLDTTQIHASAAAQMLD